MPDLILMTALLIVTAYVGFLHRRIDELESTVRQLEIITDRQMQYITELKHE